MNFNLRRACDNCPFRIEGGIRLQRDRARQIADCVLAQGAGGTFPCHKTLDYNTDNEDGEPEHTAGTQHCAGALALALNCGRETQAMQIARRLRFWHPADTDRAGIFQTRAAFLRANRLR